MIQLYQNLGMLVQMGRTAAGADGVITALAGSYPGMPPALQAAARHIARHPSEAGACSVRELAERASLHPNTFVRLARHIGFDGYASMRRTIRGETGGGDPGGFGGRTRLLREMGEKGGAAVVGEMASALAANVAQAFRGRNTRRLAGICDGILSARHVYVLGVGAAHSLAHQFWYVARMALGHLSLVPGHGSQPIDDLAAVGKEDLLVAITFHPYRTETVAAAEFARRRAATVAAVTDSPDSPLARLAKWTLVCPTRSPQFFQSHAAATGLLEALAALLVARAPADAQVRIEAFHAERARAGMYAEERRGNGGRRPRAEGAGNG